MSVRTTDRLIGDAVTVSAIPNSPIMVVTAINDKDKTVTAFWFNGNNDKLTSIFPATAHDRVEPKAPPKPANQKLPNLPAKAGNGSFYSLFVTGIP